MMDYLFQIAIIVLVVLAQLVAAIRNRGRTNPQPVPSSEPQRREPGRVIPLPTPGEVIRDPWGTSDSHDDMADDEDYEKERWIPAPAPQSPVVPAPVVAPTRPISVSVRSASPVVAFDHSVRPVKPHKHPVAARMHTRQGAREALVIQAILERPSHRTAPGGFRR